MAEALGILETTGLTGIIAGGDAMAKAAKVDLSGWDRVGSGMATIFCRGDVASVKSAVDAGSQAASKVVEVRAVHVIARPHGGLGVLLPSSGGGVVEGVVPHGELTRLVTYIIKWLKVKRVLGVKPAPLPT